MVITQPLGNANENHNFAVIEEASKLFDLEYSVYIEYPIKLLTIGKAVVDIYATKNNLEIIVEVGTLNCPKVLMDKWQNCEISLSVEKTERLKLLKEAKPNAKIIWVHQGKNWIASSEIQQYNSDLRFKNIWKIISQKEI